MLYRYYSGWKIAKGGEREDENGRTIRKVVLGEYKGESKPQYIVEEIYEDLLQEIIEDHETCKLFVDDKCTPKITLIRDGHIYITNDKSLAYKKRLFSILETLDKEVLIDAYREIVRNRGNREKLGPCITAVVANVNMAISKEEPVKHSTQYIAGGIVEYCEQTLFKFSTPLEESLRIATKEELETIFVDICKGELLGEMPDNAFLIECLEDDYYNLKVKVIRDKFRKELEYRFFIGELV